MAGLCAMIMTEPPTPLRRHRPDAPAELETLVARCLDKDLGRRVQNVADFARELMPFAPRSSRTSVERIVRVIQSAGFDSAEILIAFVPAEDEVLLGGGLEVIE